jgi:hypothetical protein
MSDTVDPEAAFAEIDHPPDSYDPISAVDPPGEDHPKEGRPEEPKDESTPLSEILLLVGDMAVSRLWPDDPLSDSEKRALFASATKLELHYKDYLDHKELILWIGFGTSIVAIAGPRALKYGWKHDRDGRGNQGQRENHATGDRLETEDGGVGQISPGPVSAGSDPRP